MTLNPITQRPFPLLWDDSASVVPTQPPAPKSSTPVEYATSIAKAHQPIEPSTDSVGIPKLPPPQVSNEQWERSQKELSTFLTHKKDMIYGIISCFLNQKDIREMAGRLRAEESKQLLEQQEKIRKELNAKYQEMINTDLLSWVEYIRYAALGTTIASLSISYFLGNPFGALSALNAAKQLLNAGSAAGTAAEKYIHYQNDNTEAEKSKSRFEWDKNSEQSQEILSKTSEDFQAIANIWKTVNEIVRNYQEAARSMLN
ncbi:MAG: hypothetical protein WB791_05655 [Waddliaceae bacterium]